MVKSWSTVHRTPGVATGTVRRTSVVTGPVVMESPQGPSSLRHYCLSRWALLGRGCPVRGKTYRRWGRTCLVPTAEGGPRSRTSVCWFGDVPVQWRCWCSFSLLSFRWKGKTQDVAPEGRRGVVSYRWLVASARVRLVEVHPTSSPHVRFTVTGPTSPTVLRTVSELEGEGGVGRSRSD